MKNIFSDTRFYTILFSVLVFIGGFIWTPQTADQWTRFIGYLVIAFAYIVAELRADANAQGAIELRVPWYERKKFWTFIGGIIALSVTNFFPNVTEEMIYMIASGIGMVTTLIFGQSYLDVEKFKAYKHWLEYIDDESDIDDEIFEDEEDEEEAE